MASAGISVKPLISICHRKTLSLPKKVGQGQRFLCVGKQHPDGAGEGTVGRGERDHMSSGLGVVHQKGACAFRRNVEGVRRLPLRIPYCDLGAGFIFILEQKKIGRILLWLVPFYIAVTKCTILTKNIVLE